MNEKKNYCKQKETEYGIVYMCRVDGLIGFMLACAGFERNPDDRSMEYCKHGLHRYCFNKSLQEGNNDIDD